jgi:hypothetical protein
VKKPMEEFMADRDTFFDRNVQKVLLQRHPSKFAYRNTSEKAYPIFAWKTADQFLTGPKPIGSTKLDLLTLLGAEPKWFADLIGAISEAKELLKKNRRKSKTALAEFLNWRDDRFLYASWDDRLAKRAQESSKNGSKLKQMEWADSWKKFQKDRATMPFKLDEFEANKTPTIRKAIHKERRRREVIVRKWMDSLVCYFEPEKVSPKSNSSALPKMK